MSPPPFFNPYYFLSILSGRRFNPESEHKIERISVSHCSIDNMGVTLSLVKESDHTAFVTDAIAEQELNSGALAPLAAKIDFGASLAGLMRLSAHSLSPSAELFFQYLRDSGGTQNKDP